MADEITFSESSPPSGRAGTIITISIPEGIPDAQPGTLIAMGGMFSHEGRVYPTANASILDSTNYTSFSIELPEEVTEPGDYEFEMYLSSAGKIGRKISLISDFPFSVVPEASTLIVSVVPSEISKNDLPDRNLMIRGKQLQGIDQSNGFFLRPGNIMLRILTLTDISATVRVTSFASLLEPGMYTVGAHLKTGGMASSSARLKVSGGEDPEGSPT